MNWRRLTLLVVVVSLSFAMTLIPGQEVSAQTRPANDSEQAAKDWAERDLRNGECFGPYGAMWLTADDNSDVFNSTGNITVEADQTTAWVRLRGSLYSFCAGAQTGYATNVRRGTGANAERLIDLLPHSSYGSGESFLRGTVSGINGTWTAPSATMLNYLRIQVDVSNVAEPGESATITVPIFRCYGRSRYNIWPETNCKTEAYRLTVNREASDSWQTEAGSYIKTGDSTDSNWGDRSRQITVGVGDTIHFKHTLNTATGGDALGTDVDWKVVGNSDFFQDGNQTYQSSGNPRNQGVASQGGGIFLQTSPTNAVAPGNESFMTYTTRSADAGKTICQRIEFSPSHTNSSPIVNSGQSDGQTNWACAYVAYDYELTPAVSLDAGCTSSCDKEVESGTSNIEVPPSIIYPPNQPIKDTAWKMTSFVVKPNQTIPGSTEPDRNGFKSSESDPCSALIYNRSGQVYQSAEADPTRNIKGCTLEDQGEISGADFGNSGRLSVDIMESVRRFDVPESAEVGTKYCFALSISPYSMTDTENEAEQSGDREWYHGQPGCIIVVKKPKAQIWGGGLTVGEGAVGLTSSRNGRLYGSWVEYEIVALSGLNNNVASSSVFAYPDGTIGFGATGSSTPQRTVQNRLTFANTNRSGTIGSSSGAEYGNLGGMLNSRFMGQITAYLESLPSDSNSTNISGVISSDRVYKPNGEVFIGDTVLSEDTTLVVYAPGRTVNIRGNIRLGGDFDVNKLSQMVIVAENIKIDGEVEQIDAWLVSENEINTCAREGGNNIAVSDLREGVCSKVLRVNGPVYVGGTGESLKLRRTGGSTGPGDGVGHPAEIFNLPAETYLWLQNNSTATGRIQTTYTLELPVRF